MLNKAQKAERAVRRAAKKAMATKAKRVSHGKRRLVNGRSVVWLCGACGKQGRTRMDVGDESCYLNSIKVYEDSFQRNGRSVRAMAVPNQKRSDDY